MRVVPLTELEFELQLPDGVKTAAVNVLLGPGGVVVKQKGNRLTVTVEKVEIWSAMEIIWEDVVLR